uniref:Uncharacterized protein n=1 Tax=Gracilariopsis lemaneiformis TaxID=2782 RepID=A0A0C5DCW4_GRALE|nr:hypothetical protein [Gracilariopsis lemaneiformis]AJO68535.1 hypothetical protein [Gracilariopsis lemaneiformis]AML79824.1 hypothetical protein [Gracilariopsis lemaneiformis]
MLKKYRDVKIQEVIELLSCIDKETKIKTNRMPMNFKSPEEVDRLLGKVAKTQAKLFEEP